MRYTKHNLGLALLLCLATTGVFAACQTDTSTTRNVVCDYADPTCTYEDLEYPDLEKLRVCKRHKDCVIERLDCCGCEHGGESFSINRSAIAEWNKYIIRFCGAHECLLANSCLPKMRAACVNNRCELVYEDPETKKY